MKRKKHRCRIRHQLNQGCKIREVQFIYCVYVKKYQVTWLNSIENYDFWIKSTHMLERCDCYISFLWTKLEKQSWKLFVMKSCSYIWFLHTTGLLKGQLISKANFKVFIWPKKDPKNLKDFCPMYCKNSQGRNPSNFLGHFWFKWKFRWSTKLQKIRNWP